MLGDAIASKNSNVLLQLPLEKKILPAKQVEYKWTKLLSATSALHYITMHSNELVLLLCPPDAGPPSGKALIFLSIQNFGSHHTQYEVGVPPWPPPSRRGTSSSCWPHSGLDHHEAHTVHTRAYLGYNCSGTTFLSSLQFLWLTLLKRMKFWTPVLQNLRMQIDGVVNGLREHN